MRYEAQFLRNFAEADSSSHSRAQAVAASNHGQGAESLDPFATGYPMPESIRDPIGADLDAFRHDLVFEQSMRQLRRDFRFGDALLEIASGRLDRMRDVQAQFAQSFALQ